MDKLFEFQDYGASWLTQAPFRLLADEMGLGKTIQAIHGLESVHATSFLVICPSVARVNWLREFLDWSKVKRNIKILKNLKDKVSGSAFNICSYDYATANYSHLAAHKWDVLILDEFHFLKSTDAKRTKAIIGKDGIVHSVKRCWMLTGTPAPNHAGELWALFFITGLTRLKYDDFIKKFCNVRDTSYGIKITGTNINRVPELKQQLKKVMLRRLKKDVMKELPPINYHHKVMEPGLVDAELLPDFAKYYIPTNKSDELYAEIDRQQKLVDHIFSSVGHNQDQLRALNAISQSVSTLRRYVGLQKVEPTIEKVTKALESQAIKKVVLFAIHRDVIEGLRAGLRKFKPVCLYGGTDPEKRQRNIDRFQTNPKCQVFIGNILAAGTAITLTAAHNVWFVEQDWVPGNNAQAVMRCHRIGQDSPVTVNFFALADSLDSRIAILLKNKTRDLTLLFDE